MCWPCFYHQISRAWHNCLHQIMLIVCSVNITLPTHQPYCLKTYHGVHSVKTGQGFELQTSRSRSGSRHGLSMSLSPIRSSRPQARSRTRSPPPQVKLHSLQSDHGPSTKTRFFLLFSITFIRAPP